MKKIIKTTLLALAIVSALLTMPVNKANAQFSASISLQTFYDDLDPYGQWVMDPDYGYVWIADAEPGFRPYYSRGHWVMTSYGATWVSDYSWGWAPFHYGRWAYSSYYGWVWMPDTEWGPAWVSWRSGGDAYGWAPLGPGISISLTFGSGYNIPNDWWVFVPSRYAFEPSFYNYRVAPERNVTYITNTTIINNTYNNNNIVYAAGPRVADVERASGKKVPVYSIANDNRPGRTAVQGNAVKAYRPQVAKTGGGKPKDAISRDQYVQKKGERHVAPDKPVQRIQQDKQPQVERKQQQPQLERKQQQPQVERKQQQPQVERKQQQPQVERKQQQPQVERKQQQPQVERKQQQPQVERKQQQPQVERKQQQPQVERKQQQPQVERKQQQPQVERKQQQPQQQQVERKQQQQPTQPANKGKKGNNG